MFIIEGCAAPSNDGSLSGECSGQRRLKSVHGTYLRAHDNGWQVR